MTMSYTIRLMHTHIIIIIPTVHPLWCSPLHSIFNSHTLIFNNHNNNIIIINNIYNYTFFIIKMARLPAQGNSTGNKGQSLPGNINARQQ